MIRRDTFFKSRAERARSLLPIIAIGLVVGALATQVMRGDRGLLAWLETTAQIQNATQTHKNLQQQNADLAKRIARLRTTPDDSSLDLDYLDERARRVLGVTHPQEIVIIY